MRFSESGIPGAWVIEVEPVGDARGSFARVFCEEEFARHGIETRYRQHSISRSASRGTLRGLHFQLPPHQETKVVTCLRGAIYDVCVDLRPGSPTFKQWRAVELTGENQRRFVIPEGCAHGFQALTDDAEVLYLISTNYNAGASSGVRWDDPAFGVSWPLPVAIMSDRDRAWPPFTG
ncbi:MAG: dTDP-4-dehydrorhamnose 3,5-epimerase [Hyphomonadaceae bacterium]|nr:dTDP-4-dehydrorhamnose 3,5-epimerase [Hyphomonadaceae bacterium]